MGSIMILGPSAWKHPKRESPTPLEVRLMLRDVGEFAVGERPLLMEDEPDLPGELNFGKFRRVIRERDVQTFAVYWPAEARLNGVDIELGFLLSAIHEGRLDSADVYLLIEKKITKIGEKGNLELSESGNRTRYYQDLINVGCPIRRWRNEEELATAMANIATEHAVTMIGGDRRIDWVEPTPLMQGQYHWICGLCQKTSMRTFPSWKRAHIDSMRHRNALHRGRDAVLTVVRRPETPSAVPGPFLAGCGVCRTFLPQEFQDVDLADEALELHRRAEHSEIAKVALVVMQRWSVDAHPEATKKLLMEKQQSVDDGDTHAWGEPRMVELSD